jgi:Fic family protein
MYEPKFNITNEILSNIGLIEAAKEVIENSPLVPVYEARFVKDAILRTVHHGTHIEGNDLSLNEAKRVMEGESVVARDRDVQEVINYRKVLDVLEELVPKRIDGDLEYRQAMLKRINAVACDRIIEDGQAGEFRSTQVILRNSGTGEVVFRPPKAIEVPFLLEDFFTWLNSATGRRVHPVIRAGITHYVLVAVHPFVEANGRTARAFTTLVLFAEGYDIKRFFSLEEYFDKDAEAYYRSMMEVDHQSTDLSFRDVTAWLEYFTQAMAIELTRVKDKVKQLSLDLKMKSRVGNQVSLNERQTRIMEYLQEKGAISLAEARKVVPGYSPDTLTRDFNFFVEKGIVKKEGKTKAARYLLR